MKTALKVKVCGMKFPENIKEVVALEPDMIGFIFYPKSPRYAEPLDLKALESIPPSIKKIGVFVNEDLENILTEVYKYKLDGVQLHGTEMVKMCIDLRDTGLIIIKAFPIAEAFNFKVTNHYEGVCDYFLFDTKTDVFGGSGTKFDWKMIREYNGQTPFILSGGIALDDVDDILDIEHPKMVGVDLNSRFEFSPGLKDIHKLKRFIHRLKAQ